MHSTVLYTQKRVGHVKGNSLNNNHLPVILCLKLNDSTQVKHYRFPLFLNLNKRNQSTIISVCAGCLKSMEEFKANIFVCMWNKNKIY